MIHITTLGQERSHLTDRDGYLAEYGVDQAEYNYGGEEYTDEEWEDRLQETAALIEELKANIDKFRENM